jgi:dihydrofolate reductase
MTAAPDLRGARVVLVAAFARNRVIGDRGRIPWHLAEDFAHFKRETLGHTLVMGRATWDSIGRPLPGRTTVVVTRDRDWSPGEHAEDVRVAHSVEDALALAARLPGDVVVAGGEQVYRAALPWATHQVLTEVDLEPDGDARYPEVDPADWQEVRREHRDGFDWVWWERAEGSP